MSVAFALGVWLLGLGEAPTERIALDATCVACHPREAAQWRGSPHATASTGPAFRAAHDREPQAFCRGCHAPEQDPVIAEITPAAALGVTCVGCHVARDQAPPADDGHPAMREVDCDGCHEFGFPDDAVREHPLAMQRTVSEHRASPAADRSCASCHMPRDDHGVTAAAMLDDALAISVQRIADDRLRVTLQVADAGHAVPTGDLFRRLEVGAIAIDAATPRRAALRWLGRRFARRVEPSGVSVLAEIEDSRVQSDRTSVIEMTVPGATERPIAWWVAYQRVAFPRGPDPAAAVLDGQTPIAGGLLHATWRVDGS